jgi:hypothetical protein
LQALTLAHKQFDTHLLFQLLEPCRQIGRNPVQTLSRTGDRTFFGHCLKIRNWLNSTIFSKTEQVGHYYSFLRKVNVL